MPTAEQIVSWIFPSGWIAAAVVLGIVASFAVGILASVFEWKRLQPAGAILAFGTTMSGFCLVFTADWRITIAFFLWLTIAPGVAMLSLAVSGYILNSIWKWLGGE